VASAQSVPEDKRVFFTFSGAVAVPGVTLPAGQYLFRLPTTIASGERHVMQVLSADGRNSYAMFFGISANRTDYPTKPEVRFMETAAGMPPAVKTWSYPGDKAGYEFLFRDPLEREANPRRLRQLAEQSGGEAFEPHDIGRVPSVLEHIARAIRNMYTLGYASAPEKGPGLRPVRVRVSAPGRGSLPYELATDISSRTGADMPRRFLLFVLRWLQRVLLVAGAGCFAWVFVSWQDATFFQLYSQTELRHLMNDMKAPQTGLPRFPAPLRRVEPVVGLLTVPRLAISVVAVEGDDDRVLRVAAGHLRDTPLPWEGGNASFAGHRDSFFRALRDIRVGDEIEIATTRGTFRYRVTRMLIVNPGDLSVLEPLDGAALTLITCYPFSYLGDAPQRFVVRAVREEEIAS
jgi:sortase A